MDIIMTQLINAIYEHGVLRPLKPLHLSEKEKVCVMVTPIVFWRKELESLLRRVHKRTAKFSAKEIEADVTRAIHAVRRKTK